MLDVHWRKSSYSAGSGNQGDCVEVAFLPAPAPAPSLPSRTPRAVAVRDSKAPAAGTLTVSAETWRHIGEVAR